MFQNLKKLRKTLKMTQQDLAIAAGLNHVTVSKIEKGEIAPRLETIHKIASAFGMTTDDFLNHIDPTCLPTSLPAGKEPPAKGLREIRESHNMSQGALARALDLNVMTISNIENGKHYPNPLTAQKLADFFRISLDDFYSYLTPDGSPFVNCGDCVYWNALEHTRDGECLKGRPVAILDKVTRRAVWPVTDKDRKCGEGKCI